MLPLLFSVLLLCAQPLAAYGYCELGTLSPHDGVCHCDIAPYTACEGPTCQYAAGKTQHARVRWPVTDTNNSQLEYDIPPHFARSCPTCRCRRPCSKVIFVVGCGHSGLTIVHTLLGIEQETGWFSTRSRAQREDSFLFHSMACAKAGKLVVVEKTSHHVQHLGNLQASFPNASLVFVTRDGRDVAASVATRYPDRRHTPSALTARWILTNDMARPLLVNPRAHWLRYEDLIDNPKRALGRLFWFLAHAPPPAEVIRRLKRPGDVNWGGIAPVRDRPDPTGDVNRAFRNWQINQPLFSTSVGRWHSDLADADVRGMFADPKFSLLMAKFGYSVSAGHNTTAREARRAASKQ